MAVGRGNKTKGGGPHNFRGGSAFHAQKAANKKICEENIAAFQALSPKDQLKELDSRLGKGVGAIKQRARLEKVITG